MTKGILMMTLFSVSTIFLSGCDLESQIMTSDDNTQNITEEDQVSGIEVDKYIVTENMSTISQSEQEIVNFSVYTEDGTFVKEIEIPEDAVEPAAGSRKVFGNKIYYLSGSESGVAISELDPFTAEYRKLLFTQTEPLTKIDEGNVLFPIIAWAVSSDNKKIAWITANGTLHLSNIDNTKHRQYLIEEVEGEVGNARVSFSDNADTLYFWRQRESMLNAMDTKSREITPLVTAENGEYSISSKGKYLAYSNFETPLAIQDLSTGNEVQIVKPEESDFITFVGFNADESRFYFGSEVLNGETEYYAVNVDGTDLNKVDDPRLIGVVNINMELQNEVVAQCVDGVCLINFMDESQQPQIISDEWFLGILKVAKNKIENPVIGIIALDQTKAIEEYKEADTIGCNDKVAEMNLEGVLTIEEALDKLFEFKDYDSELGYYNVFENSQNLVVDSVNIDDNGLAKVELSGDLLTGGTCDNPRVAAQIEKTLRQIDGVKGVKIYINGEDINDFLSEKG